MDVSYHDGPRQPLGGSSEVKKDYIMRVVAYLKRIILALDEEKLDDKLFVLRGFARGFLLWAIPLVVFARRVNNLRRAVAIGIGVGIVRGMTRLSSQKKQLIPPFKYKNFTIGVIAGSIFLFLDGKIQESPVLVFWILIRALYNIVPSVPYGNIMVMCFSASQLLSSWIAAPSSQLNKSYLSFLNWQGGQFVEDINFVKAHLPVPRHCFLVHPESTCPEFLVQFFFDGLVRALRLYLPLNVVLLLTAQTRSIFHFLENIIRSCLFLSSYCTLAWASACTYYSFFPGISRKSLFLHTWVSGLAVLLERKGRRTELAIYCLTYAMDSFYRYYKETTKGNGFKLPKRLLLVLSGAMLFHYHKNQPSFVMKWLMQLNDDNTAPLTPPPSPPKSQ